MKSGLINMGDADRLISNEELGQTSSEEEENAKSSTSVHSSICGTDDENSSEGNNVIKTIPLGAQTNTTNKSMLDVNQKFDKTINIQNCANVLIGNKLNLEISAKVAKNVNQKRKHLRKHRNQSRTSVKSTTDSTDEDDDNGDEYIGHDGFLSCVDIVTRREWLAQGPMKKCISLKKPIEVISISHTETESSKDKGTNIKSIRDLQNYHIEHLKIKDIAYNFLIGCDGAIYEGRGWNFLGFHVNNDNKVPLGIAFIGNFVNRPPTQEALKSFNLFLEQAIKEGYLHENYQIICRHQQRLTKDLPISLILEMKKSKHFCERDLRNKIIPETTFNKFCTTVWVQLARMCIAIQEFFNSLFRNRR